MLYGATLSTYPPYILSKLAISMSIKSGLELQEEYCKTDSQGLELNRQTITGEWDELYKCLIRMFHGSNLQKNIKIQAINLPRCFG